MANTPNQKNSFVGEDYKGNPLINIDSVSINRDAATDSEVPNKAQTETISADAAQSIIIDTNVGASDENVLSASTSLALFSTKQPNLSVHPSSVGLIEIVGGTQLKVKTLTSNQVYVDPTSLDLAQALGSATHDSGLASWTFGGGKVLQEGDQLILANPTNAAQKSFIHNGGNNGDATDFTNLISISNLDEFFSVIQTDDFIEFDLALKKFSLDLGTSSTSLGAQTLPVDPSTFASVTGSTIFDLMKSLEALILQVDQSGADGTATVNSRLTNLSGVTGSNMGTFTSSIYTDNSSQKTLFTETAVAIDNATADREMIRLELSSTEQTLDAKIDQEIQDRISGDTIEQNARATADHALDIKISANTTSIITESQTRFQEDGLIKGRLDIIEGDSSTVGSIAKAQADAQAFTTSEVNALAVSQDAENAAIRQEIQNLAEGDIVFVGQIGPTGILSIRQDKVNAGDTRNGSNIKDVAVQAGEQFVAAADMTLSLNAGTSIALLQGDVIFAIDDALAGSVVSGTFNPVQSNTSSLTVANLDNQRIEKTNAGHLDIVADSIDRVQLSASVEADIDNKVLKSGDSMSGQLLIDNAVGVAGTYDEYKYSSYIKMSSDVTASLTDTQRALLVENYVKSSGSGNFLDRDYSNGATIATHYQGTCNDFSLAVVGSNSEANVTNPLAAVHATGIYALAQSTHLGINIGGTFLGMNAGTSNIGVFAVTDKQGSLNNRAGYFAFLPETVTFDQYALARQNSAIPRQNVGVLIDDYNYFLNPADETTRALVSFGISEFLGKVIVPDATEDDHAVNIQVIKNTQHKETFTLSAGTTGSPAVTTITHNLGEDIIVEIWKDGTRVTDSFAVQGATATKFDIVNTSSETGLVKVLVKAFHA